MKRYRISRNVGFVLVVCSCLAAFAFGIAVGALQIPPYGVLKEAYTTSIADMSAYETVDPRYRVTDVDALITIHTMDDVRERRAELRVFLWSNDALPTRLPTVEKDIVDPMVDNLNDVIRVDKLTVVMDWNVTSVAYHLIPEKTNGRVIIYSAGHNVDFRRDTETIQAFIDRGYAVVGMSMPLTGMNNRPTVDLPRVGKLRIDQHDQLPFLRTETTNPMKYFVEPAVIVTNYLASQYDGIDMTGLSGGGFITTLTAAVDERIQHSYPVAGTLPFYLLSGNPGTWGDYESTDPELHRIANYPELYILGAVGEGRSQTQVLNQYDSCCYAGVGYETYEPATKHAVTSIGSGNFSVYRDASHQDHRISNAAITALFGEVLQ